MRARAGVLVAVALALAARGCIADAGTRVWPAAAGFTLPTGPAGSASAELVAAADLAGCPASDPAVASRDDGLPDLVLPCLGGGPAVRLAGLRGTPTVVNAWASWCGPCREELSLFADLAVRAGSKVRVVGLDASDDPSSARLLQPDARVHYPAVRDDTGLRKAGLRWRCGPPVTAVVDAEGRIVHAEHAAVTGADELRRLVADHLGVSVPS